MINDKPIFIKRINKNFYYINFYYSIFSEIKIEIFINSMDASSGDNVYYVNIDDLYIKNIRLPFDDNHYNFYDLFYL